MTVIFVSSVKFTILLDTTLSISYMYITNKHGPKTDQCSTFSFLSVSQHFIHFNIFTVNAEKSKVIVGNNGGKMIVYSVLSVGMDCTVCIKWINKWCSGDLSLVADGFRCNEIGQSKKLI